MVRSHWRWAVPLAALLALTAAAAQYPAASPPTPSGVPGAPGPPPRQGPPPQQPPPGGGPVATPRQPPSRQGIVSGSVYDKSNEKPIPEAVLQLTPVDGGPEDALSPETTDAQGAYSFQGVPAGEYRLSIEARDHNPQTLKVTVNASGAVRNAYLEPTGAFLADLLLKGFLLLGLPIVAGVVLWKYALDMLGERILEEHEFTAYEERFRGDYYPVEGQLNAWKKHWLPGPKVEAVEPLLADAQARYEKAGGKAHRRIQRVNSLLRRSDQLATARTGLEGAWRAGGEQLWSRALLAALVSYEADIAHDKGDEEARLSGLGQALGSVREALAGSGAGITALPSWSLPEEIGAPGGDQQVEAGAAPDGRRAGMAQAISEIHEQLRYTQQLQESTAALLEWTRDQLLPQLDAILDQGPLPEALATTLGQAGLSAVEPQPREPADAACHEEIAQGASGDGFEPGHVIRRVSRGYRWRYQVGDEPRDIVLRRAQVVVATEM